MVWFMVWIKITSGNRNQPGTTGFGWFGVCFPINTAGMRVFHRKSLEHTRGLMLQKQRMHFVF